MARVTPLGNVVIKPARVTDARTKVGEAGMGRTRVYDPKANGPVKALLAGLQQTILHPPLQDALARYRVGAVYTDAHAAAYLESTALAVEMDRFSRINVPLVHALGAAYGHHQIWVVVDIQPPTKSEAKTRLWFVGNKSSFSALSALAQAEAPAEASEPGKVEVLRTIPLADRYSAVVVKDGTGTYIQKTLGGANAGPRIVLRTDDLPVERCNPITVANYLGASSPGASRVTETLDHFRAEVEAQRVGSDDEIDLALQIGDRWETMLAAKAVIEGIAKHGIAKGFGKKLFVALKAVTDEAIRTKISGDPEEAARGVLKKDDEMIAFINWAFDDSGVSMDIRSAFREPAPWDRKR